MGIYDLCGRDVQRVVDEMMMERIDSGLSRLYPERGHYSLYDITHQYILVNYACAIVFMDTKEVFDMKLSDFRRFMTDNHEEVIRELSYNNNTYSYDRCIKKDSDNTFLDCIPDNHAKRPAGEAIKSYTTESLMAYMDGLSSLQKRIIEGIYFKYKTETKMAVELGMSQSNVHHYKEKALQKLYQLCIEDGIAPGDYE